MAQVRLEKVTKNFKQQTVLKTTDLTIDDKEFLTLVGPSGCGKSTTLNIIAGLEEPTSGAVYFDNKDVTYFTPKERDIAFVFQSYALYPHKNVYENMAFPLRMKGLDKKNIQTRVQETAKLLNIENLLTRKPKQLSGGQRQRVALGRAIVRRPKVFLLDEPLSNLDAKLRVYMRAELKKLHQNLATTFIYVTHDQAEAMTLSDRVAVMNEGIILQCDTPQNIFDKPQNLFVAGFVGSPPLNLLKTSFKETAGNLEFTLEGGITFQTKRRYRLSTLKGQELILGIRPHQLILSHVAEENFFPAQVLVLEPMGSETFVFLQQAGKYLIARVDPSFPVKPGEIIYFSFKESGLHLFNPQTEERIQEE